MSILQLSAIKIGQIGVQPNTFKMLSTDSLATITTAGYLHQGTAGQTFTKNDLLETIYNYNSNSSTNIELYVTIDSAGIITLNESVASGVVTVSGSVTTGHVATFASSTSIQDGGALGNAAFKSVSNNSDPRVVSVTGILPVGNIPSFSDTSGSLQDSSIVASNVQIKTNIIAGQRIFAGGSTSFSIGNALFTSSSIAVVSFLSQTNASSIVTVVPTTSNVTVNFSADPGASVLSFVAFVAPQ